MTMQDTISTKAETLPSGSTVIPLRPTPTNVAISPMKIEVVKSSPHFLSFFPMEATPSRVFSAKSGTRTRPVVIPIVMVQAMVVNCWAVRVLPKEVPREVQAASAAESS